MKKITLFISLVLLPFFLVSFWLKPSNISAQVTECVCICGKTGKLGGYFTYKECASECSKLNKKQRASLDAQDCKQRTEKKNQKNQTIELPNPISEKPIGPEELYARVIKAFLAFVGVAGLVAFVYAGFAFIFSGGNQEKVIKAKNTMVYAVLGIAIAFGAFAILNFILDALTTPTG